MTDKRNYMIKDEIDKCKESMKFQVKTIMDDINNPSNFNIKKKPEVSYMEEEVINNGDE